MTVLSDRSLFAVLASWWLCHLHSMNFIGGSLSSVWWVESRILQ